MDGIPTVGEYEKVKQMYNRADESGYFLRANGIGKFFKLGENDLQGFPLGFLAEVSLCSTVHIADTNHFGVDTSFDGYIIHYTGFTEKTPEHLKEALKGFHEGNYANVLKQEEWDRRRRMTAERELAEIERKLLEE